MNNLQKVTKAQVKAVIKKRGTVKVWLCPSNTVPSDSPFNMASLFDLSAYILPTLKEKITRFERTVDSFTYYNCNSETGYRVHYYMEVV